MELYHRKTIGRFSEYVCKITSELDDLAHFDEDTNLWPMRHYVLMCEHAIKNDCLPIRVPGGTVGGIWYDDNHAITKIFIDTDYVVKTYPENVNEILQKYVGKKIELE